jgi:hypothetical protein
MEPGPGERFEIDWGHFGALLYKGHARKLYAFCLVECHSLQTVCRVYSQPEFRDLRALSHPRLLRNGFLRKRCRKRLGENIKWRSSLYAAFFLIQQGNSGSRKK